MQCAALSAGCKLEDRIRTLEDSASLLVDLANGLPEHSEWLWDIADKLTNEAATLEGRSIHRSSTVPDST